MLYSSLLVCCHRVVNKDCRLLPSAPGRGSCRSHSLHPAVRIHCICCSASVARIHRALLFAFIAPTFNNINIGAISMSTITTRSNEPLKNKFDVQNRSITHNLNALCENHQWISTLFPKYSDQRTHLNHLHPLHWYGHLNTQTNIPKFQTRHSLSNQ